MFTNCYWIWGAEGKADEYVDFRLDLDVREGKRYLLHLSCDTDYALYDGDKLIAFGQYADYPHYRVYDTVDLSSHLSPGEHALQLTVWYQGVETQTYKDKGASLIFLVTEDGEPVLTSGEHIESRVSAGYVPYGCRVITGQLGLSFKYDASAPAGEYRPSRIINGNTKELYPRPIEKLGISQPFDAVAVQSGGYSYTTREGNNSLIMQHSALSQRGQRTLLDGDCELTITANQGEDGVYAILDMGRECAGLLHLDFSVDSESKVIVGWGEHVADGRVRTSIHARDFSCEYTASPGDNLFTHPFRRLGCRYLQIFIEGKSATLRRVSVMETRYPVTVRGLNSDDLLRRRIYDVCVNTLIQCMHEHYEDCPWREQALYTMDSRNQMLCGYYTFGEYRFPKACLELISHGMREDGILSLCYPAGKDLPIPAFSLVYFIQMWEYLSHSSDIEFIREKYPFLKKLLSTFTSRVEENGLMPIFEDGPWNFYEWSPGLEGNCPDRLQAPLNAFYSLALTHMARIADKLGEDADVDDFKGKAARVNKAIYKNFFDNSVGLFRTSEDQPYGYSVLTNSLCLLCGAAEAVDKSTIYKILAANGPADTGIAVVSNTLSMNTFRFDALLAEDRERFEGVILDEIDRTYLTMLEQGATSFWETAAGEADFGGAGSLCHGWSALPAYYYKTLCEA